MATTPQAVTRSAERGAQRAAGEGPPPSLDALHPHGRVRREPRDPGDRARRGLVRLRRARQPLHGRAVGAVLRERRPRPRRAGRGGRAPGQGARLLHQLELRPPGRDRAGRAHRRRSRPGDLNRVFFTSGGSEAVESAWKLARQYHKLTGRPASTRSSRARPPTTAPPSGRSRSPASLRCARRSSRSYRAPSTLPNTNDYRWPEDRDPLWAADADRARDRVPGPGDGRGRDPRAGAELRRLLRARRTATGSACARSATATTCC